MPVDRFFVRLVDRSRKLVRLLFLKKYHESISVLSIKIANKERRENPRSSDRLKNDAILKFQP